MQLVCFDNAAKEFISAICLENDARLRAGLKASREGNLQEVTVFLRQRLRLPQTALIKTDSQMKVCFNL